MNCPPKKNGGRCRKVGRYGEVAVSAGFDCKFLHSRVQPRVTV